MSSQDGKPQALYVRDGDHWLPTEAGRGPWDPRALHGGAVAPLLVRCLERLEAPVPMRLARVTIELLRPVTLEPLVATSTIVRNGAKVGLLEADLTRASDGVEVARARALRIRTAEVDFAEPELEPVPALPDTDADVDGSGPGGLPYVAFHNTAVRHRFADGVFGAAGPAFDWIRLVLPVVQGEEPTPWQRVVAAADFANGISSAVPFDGAKTFINPDLTVHLWREPVGEWVGIDATTRVSLTGIGASDSSVWDRDGRIGRTNQSLLLDTA